MWMSRVSPVAWSTATLDEYTTDLDAAVARVVAAKEAGEALSVGPWSATRPRSSPSCGAAACRSTS